jgi:hypothetical protein
MKSRNVYRILCAVWLLLGALNLFQDNPGNEIIFLGLAAVASAVLATIEE